MDEKKEVETVQESIEEIQPEQEQTIDEVTSSESVTTPEDEKTATRTYKGHSESGFLGAPISWIAMVGALMGALAIVPFLFYPVGGGFTSLGMGIFGPMGGVLLGPWAGALAGTIGGIIGMFISPGAYMFGFVDVALSGAFLCIAWGLMMPKYRKITLIVYPIVMIVGFVLPYHIPGEAGGFIAKEPDYILSYSGGIIAMFMYIFFAKAIWKMMLSPKQGVSLIGYFLINYIATWLWMGPWMYVAYFIARFPVETAIINNWGQHWMTVLPMTITGGLISYFLTRAMKQGNMRKIPGSWATLGTDVDIN